MKTDPIVTHFIQIRRNDTKPRLGGTIKSNTNRSKTTIMTNSNHKQQYRAYQCYKGLINDPKAPSLRLESQVGGPNTFTNEESQTQKHSRT